jgi:hypothetical protein
MQNLIAFLTAFDPLALLFIAGIVAFVVFGGVAVMRDNDVPKFDPGAIEGRNAPTPDPEDELFDAD